jgi:hypothetical protein
MAVKKRETRHVVRICPWCGKDSSMDVDAAAYFEWTVNSVPIHVAFPDLYEDEREQLQTGYHPECFNELWTDEDY